MAKNMISSTRTRDVDIKHDNVRGAIDEGEGFALYTWE